MSQNKGLAPFVMEVTQIASGIPSPLWGGSAREARRGAGLRMLIVGAVAKALI